MSSKPEDQDIDPAEVLRYGEILEQPEPVPESVELEPPSQGEVSDFQSRVGLARRRLESAPRDELGIASYDISLTYPQTRWLAARLDAETDEDADTVAGIEPIQRAFWQRVPDFQAVYESCIGDKREALRILGAQLLPKALRVIDRLMDESSGPRSNAKGLEFLLRTQGLLVDRQRRVDPNELASLLIALRAAQTPELVAPEPR